MLNCMSSENVLFRVLYFFLAITAKRIDNFKIRLKIHGKETNYLLVCGTVL